MVTMWFMGSKISRVKLCNEIKRKWRNNVKRIFFIIVNIKSLWKNVMERSRRKWLWSENKRLKTLSLWRLMKTLMENPYWKLLMNNFIKRGYNINKTNIGEGIEKPSWPPNEGMKQSTQSSSPNIRNEEKPFVVEALNLRTLKPTINIAFGFLNAWQNKVVIEHWSLVRIITTKQLWNIICQSYFLKHHYLQLNRLLTWLCNRYCLYQFKYQ